MQQNLDTVILLFYFHRSFTFLFSSQRNMHFAFSLSLFLIFICFFNAISFSHYFPYYTILYFFYITTFCILFVCPLVQKSKPWNYTNVMSWVTDVMYGCLCPRGWKYANENTHWIYFSNLEKSVWVNSCDWIEGELRF